MIGLLPVVLAGAYVPCSADIVGRSGADIDIVLADVAAEVGRYDHRPVIWEGTVESGRLTGELRSIRVAGLDEGLSGRLRICGELSTKTSEPFLAVNTAEPIVSPGVLPEPVVRLPTLTPTCVDGRQMWAWRVELDGLPADSVVGSFGSPVVTGGVSRLDGTVHVGWLTEVAPTSHTVPLVLRNGASERTVEVTFHLLAADCDEVHSP